MQRSNAIEVVGLSKRYVIGRHKASSITEAISNTFAGRKRKTSAETNEIWPLKDISFTVPQGQTLGIVGRNGAGKSTLLKILSRITTPTEGYSRTYGRVGSLLEVGTGFSRELTGRENVYLNGTILGMKRQEITRQFDDIVAFANVERFIDTPLKRYSSGMQMRLAFSVAAHLAADILIIDEVLAVGDDEFQKRCMAKMGEIEKSGRTILLVSHNMAAVRQLCSRSIFLSEGSIIDDGPTPKVLDTYLDASGGKSQIQRPRKDQPFTLTEAKMNDAGENETVKAGESFTLALTGYLRDATTQCMVSAYLLTNDGTHVFDEFTPESVMPNPMTPGEYTFSFTVPGVLAPGTYRLGYWVQIVDQSWDVWEDDILVFEVSTSQRPADGRILDLRSRWTVEKAGAS